MQDLFFIVFRVIELDLSEATNRPAIYTEIFQSRMLASALSLI